MIKSALTSTVLVGVYYSKYVYYLKTVTRPLTDEVDCCNYIFHANVCLLLYFFIITCGLLRVCGFVCVNYRKSKDREKKRKSALDEILEVCISFLA